MTDLRTAFEADLHAAYLCRDFAAWNTPPADDGLAKAASDQPTLFDGLETQR